MGVVRVCVCANTTQVGQTGVPDSKGDGQAKQLMKGLLSVVGSERKAVEGPVRWSQCQAREGSAKVGD